MREPKAAIREILECIGPPLETEHVSLSQAAGRVLAQTVVSDVDLPPFEKSMMDGFAVRSADLAGARPDGWTELVCAGESRAGSPFAGRIEPGQCIACYTGAEVPADCDAVVMVERTEREDALVRINGPVHAGEHVSHIGEILGRERPVFEPGRRLSPVDVSVLAAVGCDPVTVHRRPRISILTTGDELVPPTATPGPGQIREGNTLYLRAAAERAGCEILEVGVVADRSEDLEEAFGRALAQGDALVTTGGVSMGDYDLVGTAFEALGVQPVLHKVAIKPGKPIWFGMFPGGDDSAHDLRKPVFGLPGNPVSAMLGFEVFVRPALARLGGAGNDEQAERLRFGRWMGSPPRPAVRQQNVPAVLAAGADGVLELHPLRWMGSADIVGLARAQAFAVFPAGVEIDTGDVVEYRPLEIFHTAEVPLAQR